MPAVFQPNVPLNQAIFNACDALCVLAGTERPIEGFDSLSQIEKKGANAIVALQAAGMPTGAIIAAINAKIANLEAVEYILASSNSALPNAKVIASSPTILFSTAGGSFRAYATGDALKFNILSAGTNMADTQATVRLSNSNGVSFGMNTNNVITASHNGLTSQSNQAVSAANGSFAFQTLSFSNLNGVTFGTSAGSAIWASHNGITSQSNQAFSAAGGSSAFQTLGFSDGNGVSFTNTNGSVGATVRTDYASSNHSHGNPTLALTNLSGTTASASNGFTLSLSGGAPFTQSTQPVAASGSNGSFNFSTLQFVTGNGASFYTDATGIRLSYTVPSTAGLISAVNVSAGATSNNLSALTFSNGSGVSFGLTGSVVTASVETNYQTPGAYLTTAMASNRGTDFVQATAAFAGTNASGTINSTGISVSVGNYITTARASNDAVGLNTALTANGVSWTVNSSGISLNVPAFLTTAMQSNAATISNINLSAGTTSLNASAFTFANGGGVSFGLSGNSVITATVQTNYLTTARASTDAIGLNTALTANGVSMTANSSGLSLNFPAFLTTAMASNRGSDFVAATAAFAGTNASGTIASNGISVSVNAGGGDAIRGIAANGSTASTNTVNFSNSNGVSFGFGAAGNSTVMTASHDGLTTAMASNRGTDFVQATAVFNGTNASGTMASNSWSVSVAAQSVQTQSNVQGIIVSNTTYRTGDVSFSNLNGITFGSNGANVITASHNGLTTARASTDAIGLNTAQTNVTWTVNSSGLSFNAGGYAGTTTGFTGANISASITNNTLGLAINLSVAAPGGASTYSNFFQPYDFFQGSQTATSSASLSQLHLMPFSLPVNLAFGQINYIASVPVLNTGVVGTWSIRLTGTSSMAYEAYHTISNTNFLDCFLFSRGSGGYSTELQTFASTRNSFITFQSVTFGATANHTAGSTGSMSARQSHSMSISYPMMTSGTVTSVNPASTVVTWGMGYTTWNSTASTSVSNTYNTTTTGSTSIASTMPGTTAWSSYKMVPLFCAVGSLTPGEYWLGMVRYSSTSSSSSSAQTNAAAGTGASYTTTFGASGLTRTQQISWVGQTTSIASSLGWLGFASQASMAPTPGHGSFSGTWASNTTYLNNAGNPAGAVAFSQIRTNVSFFRTWFQMASNRI